MNDYENIIKNTQKAYELCEAPFSHQELIDVIKTDNDLKKQICILRLKQINSQEEAELLLSNLTNHHGIIREAAAFKINEFLKNENFNVFFQKTEFLKTFLDAVIDMNPNICRLIIEVLPCIKAQEYFFNLLFERTLEVIHDAKTMNRRNRGYIYSKKIFKLFWYLEAIAVMGYFKDQKAIQTIIENSYDFDDYTIREKCAKIISHAKIDDKLSRYKDILLNDENYFVRRQLTQQTN